MKTLRGLPTLVLLAATGCGAFSGGRADTRGALSSGMWIARVAPAGSSFGLRGEVRLIPLTGDREMRIVFDLRSVAARARHPWVIRSGRCGETTSRELSSRAVPVIEGDLDGQARLTATIQVQLEPGNDYHLDIARSPSEPDAYIACGALVPVG